MPPTNFIYSQRSGTKLLLEIERKARETGNNKIILDVETSDQKAVKFY
ncbi:GNAT family N-acetyltransferase [candidate division KSB1 bacterium]|nr:GNAT family N-acetyltransferase [candidate division KSB1 bacterium]